MYIKTKPKNKQTTLRQRRELGCFQTPFTVTSCLNTTFCIRVVNREQYDVDTGGEARLAKQKSLYTTVCSSSDNQ